MTTFVCGQLCSGKTKYAKALAGEVAGLFIEVGDIVREIKQTTTRKELQDSKALHVRISEEIAKKIELRSNIPGFSENFVVCGVRQKEILKNFKNSTLLWIECPINTRKDRYESRARSGDSQTFEEADRGDIELGILEVKNYIFNK